MAIVESAGISDVGRKRQNNEDALFLDDALKFYMVSDGMGGHQAGEVASHMVVETLANYLRRFKADKQVDEYIDTIDPALSEDANVLLSGIYLANREVYQASKEKSSCRGMGATVSAVYLTDDTLITSNVGDSPIYLVRRDSIDLLSVSHTLMADTRASTRGMSEEVPENFKHVLTRAIGAEETVKADTFEIQCFKNDVVVICSDGLSNNVSPEEIADVVRSNRTEKACHSLVALANDRGGDDNISLIVLKINDVGYKKKGIFGRIFGIDT